MRRRPGLLTALLLLLFSALFSAACRTHGEEERTGVLPSLAPDAKASAYYPQRPLLPVSEGIVGRTVAQAASGAGYRIEVREFVAGPGPRHVAVRLEWPAVLEVLSGFGNITVGSQQQTLQPGSTLAIPAQPETIIENTGRGPLELRAYLFASE